MSDFAGLNVGCGAYRTDLPGWINTDVIRIPENVEPDVLVTPDDPLPFEDATFNKIYMGHVLEHVPWDRVVDFLELVKTKVADNGEIMVVCPDANRSLDTFLAGDADRHWYMGVLEDDMHIQETPVEWFGARHCWNAYQERVERAVNAAGFSNVRAVDFRRTQDFDGWPVTSFATWQCAVRATK